MKFRDYLSEKRVWVDGLCWPSYGQLGGSISDSLDKFMSEPIKLYVHERYGRFGNNIHQVLHALIVARNLSVKHISFKFYIDEAKTESIFIDDMILRFGIEHPPEEPQISATLFYLQGFESYMASIPYDSVKKDAECLSRALSLNVDVGDKIEHKKRVVFHFRAGDIFSTDVNPIYTQPPFSYYALVFDHICKNVKNFELYLVYEDDRNPCIGKFQELLSRRQVPYQNHSSTFQKDAKLIVSADCIVSSYSSFCDMLALMNENLDRWYAFRTAAAFECVDLSISREFSRILQSDGVKIYLIKDDSGLYTAPGEWGRSADQMDQLLNYPESSLSIELLSSTV